MDSEDILQKPAVAIVILSWNGKKFLEKFLPSVLSSTYQPLDIFVADNDSTDNTVEFLKINYPTIKIISLAKNEGFAKGYNLALNEVHSDYAILLNQDVEVNTNWIEPLVECMESDSLIAACQPKILDYTNKEMFEHAGAAGGYLDVFGYPFCKGRIFNSVEKNTGQYETQEEIFWASGAALCVRLDLYKRFKGFDEDFFAHMEEIDLCWRLKRAGYKIIYQPKSEVYHVGGGSLSKDNPKKIYLNFRNNLFMNFKNDEFVELFWKIPIRFFILDFIAFIKAVLERKWHEAGAIFKADLHFIIALPILMKKRYSNLKLFWNHRIDSSRVKKKGFYKKSIVFSYFILKKKVFKKLFHSSIN